MMIDEMAICAAQLPLRQSTGLIPTTPSSQLIRPASRLNSWANTSVAAATDVAYGMQHRDAEERAAAHPVVEQVGEAEREQQLRHRGEHADA